jgi:Gluconate 2-dehydrogenase subunit 3
LKDYCQSQYDTPFEELSVERRIAVLQHFEAKGKPAAGMLGKAQRKLMGDSFFTTLKNLTVTAWCTSKAGATQGLAYDYIPGAYIADAPLQPGQHSWATQ